MLHNLSPWSLAAIFLAAAAGVWKAGIYLSKATEVLSTRWNLGEALGGMILLAIVTNLPEIAITASGAFRQDLSIAVGNILGGIGVQTVVLVILDVIGLNKAAPLTRRVASPTIVLEAVLVITVLAVSIMGTQLPKSLIFARVTPAGLLIVVLWIVGLWMIGKLDGASSPLQTQASEKDVRQPSDSHKNDDAKQTAGQAFSDTNPIAVFAVASAVTLICGATLEISGEAIAKQLEISGVLFGATFLAAATALPEISTGLAAVKLGDYEMAVSDVLGGNAFLPVLFPLASLMTGEAVLPDAQSTDIYLSSLAILLTTVYTAGMIVRPSRQIARMGIDSFVVLLLYLGGMASFLAIPTG
jgi:cation:H+ antiporter